MVNMESQFKRDEELEEIRNDIRDVKAELENFNERNTLAVIDNRLRQLTKKTYVGDGSTGDANFNGTDAVANASRSGTTYTLTTDAYYNDVVVADGVTVVGRQYLLFVKGNLTNRGTIYANGGWW